VDYFRVASIKHYLMVDTRRRSVIHHQRNDCGDITTRILNGGQLALEPPGIEVDVSGFFIVEPSTGNHPEKQITG